VSANERAEAMRWHVQGTQPAYRSRWVEVWLDDVELPDGQRIEHHVLKFPRPSVGSVVVDDRDNLLMIWRHRYITDAWGWEVPAGWVEPNEALEDAARREIEEETGYRATTMAPLVTYNVLSGISTMRYAAFLAGDVTHIGEPSDRAETSRVEWIPLAQVPELAAAGHIVDGPTLTLVSYYLGIHRQLATYSSSE
jgi:8-oxo-dGTP pyrophosphatase MutT (NUDIX family)